MTDKIISNMKAALFGQIPTEYIRPVIDMLSGELANYNIEEKEHHLVVYDGGDAAIIQKFFLDKAVQGLSDRSLRYYRCVLTKVFEQIGKHIKDIQTDDVRMYLATCRVRKNTETSIDNERRVLSSFFGWAVKEELLQKNIMLRIDKVRTPKKVRKAFSEEELERIRNAARSIRDKAIIEFLYSTGCRISEMIALNRSDIDFTNRSCIVFGKGKKERPVYFSYRCKVLLEEYLQSRKDSCPALFVSDFSAMKGFACTYHRTENGPQRLLVEGVRHMVKMCGKRSGIDDVHPHRFRRTAATLALRRGMSIEQVQKMLGHESISTTTIYASSEQSEVKEAHDKYII